MKIFILPFLSITLGQAWFFALVGGSVLNTGESVFNNTKGNVISTSGPSNEIEKPSTIIEVLADKNSKLKQKKNKNKKTKKNKGGKKPFQKEIFVEHVKSGYCKPDIKVVELDLEEIPGYYYYPKCVRVKRCGGCCSATTLFSCQPTKTQLVTMSIMKIKYNSRNQKRSVGNSSKSQSAPGKVKKSHLKKLTKALKKLNLKTNKKRRRDILSHTSYVNITVEQHIDCDCQCINKDSNCDLDIHDYDKHHCSCDCKEHFSDEKKRCNEDNKKFWDSKRCKCRCIHIQSRHCIFGQVYDPETCSCVTKHHKIDENYIKLFLENK